MSKLIIGQPAPDFTLADQHGNRVTLKQFRGRSAVVLFFYPKDDTTGCIKEACAFRDRIKEIDAHILGVSSDSEASHAAFAAKYDLPFTLLSDPGGKVRKLYGVPKTFGILPGRATYVIDREGILKRFFSSQSQPERHIEEAISACPYES